MAFGDEEIYEYTHPTWKAGSVWTFRKFQIKPDLEKSRKLAFKVNMPKITREDILKAKRSGKDYDPDVEQINLMDSTVAELWVMSEGWDGPEFVLPATFKLKDESGNRVLHPLAGKAVPCTPEWIERVLEIDDVYREMSRVWAGGDESEESFPGEVEATPEPAHEEGRPALHALPTGD